MNQYFVYILASGKNGTLYIGVTNNLERRLEEHRGGIAQSFTQKYKVYLLVHFEHTNSINEALAREKQLKKWNRAWKLQLIESFNPNWHDLSGSPLSRG